MEDERFSLTVEVVVHCSETDDLRELFHLLRRLGGSIRAERVGLFGYCDGRQTDRRDAPDNVPLLTALDAAGGFPSTVALLRRFFARCPRAGLTISAERYGRRVSVTAGSCDRSSIAELTRIVGEA